MIILVKTVNINIVSRPRVANLMALFDWLIRNKWYYVTGPQTLFFRARAEMRLHSQATFLTVVIDLLTYLYYVFHFIITTEYTYVVFINTEYTNVDNSFFIQLKCLFCIIVR